MFKIRLYKFSSHTLYDSCDLELSVVNCLKCDPSNKRILLSTAPSKCMCEIGWYDPGVI